MTLKLLMIKIQDFETAIIKLQTSYKNSLDDVYLSIIMLHTCSIISENHYETHYAPPIHQKILKLKPPEECFHSLITTL